MSAEEVVDLEDEGEEEEPPPELTPEEKIAALKEALANGEMGPAVFDQHYQAVWLKIKATEQENTRGSRGNLRRNDDDE